MGKSLKIVVLHVIAALLTVTLMGMLVGCVTPPAPIENPRQIWCDHNQPRRPTQAVFDAMSRPEVDEMNSHNAKGMTWCGWKPSAFSGPAAGAVAVCLVFTAVPGLPSSAHVKAE